MRTELRLRKLKNSLKENPDPYCRRTESKGYGKKEVVSIFKKGKESIRRQNKIECL